MPSANRPLFIIGILFFVFGFVTWLNSVLIPYLRIACGLNNLEAYFVAFSFYISYMVMAVPAASVLKFTGYKKGMSLGLLIMAVGAIVFIPAAESKSFPVFLAGLFVQGTGMALLQTASNPYITILGPMESAARRISIMGICNGVAGVIAPAILGTIILEDADGIKTRLLHLSGAEKEATLNALAHRVVLPYSIIAAALLLLAWLVYASGLPEIDSEPEEADSSPEGPPRESIFGFPHLLFGVLTLFLYVGVEVIAGDSIITYGASQGIPISTAKFFTSCTLAFMLAGYVIGIVAIPKYIAQEKFLRLSAIAGLLFTGCALATHGYVSVLFIALLGLANAMVWPSVWPLSLRGLGKFTKIGSSFLIVAVGGGALVPLMYGWLADRFSPHRAYWIAVPIYLCILLFAGPGHSWGFARKRTGSTEATA